MGITKNLIPILVGAALALILTSVLRMGIEKIYPLPPGTDMYDSDSAAKAFALLPLNALLLLLADYAFTSFMGGLVATLLVKRESKTPALMAGIVLTLGGILLCFVLKTPGWFGFASLFTYLPFTMLGYLTVRKK